MKKYLLLLAALLIAVPDGGAEAAAVKLGRGKAYSVNSGASLGSDTKIEEKKPEGWCDTDAQCASKEKCQGNACVSVCTQPIPKPGMTMARICAGRKCIADPDTPHAFKCVDNCYNVTCKAGYTTEENGSSCCCVPTSCPSGQRLSGGSCVSNCTGVTCKSGSSPVAKANSCCCESTNACASGQIYNTTIKKCVDAVCPLGCLDSCVNGCGSCESGRYLNYSTGYCSTCSSAITNCSTCSGSSSGPTCTSCISGYTLSGGRCVAVAVACPLNCSTCSSSSKCTRCNSGYTLSGGRCSLSVDCSRCESGYTKNLTSCPYGQVLQHGRICVDSGFSCGKCVTSSSGGGGGGGGGGLVNFESRLADDITLR